MKPPPQRTYFRAVCKHGQLCGHRHRKADAARVCGFKASIDLGRISGTRPDFIIEEVVDDHVSYDTWRSRAIVAESSDFIESAKLAAWQDKAERLTVENEELRARLRRLEGYTRAIEAMRHAVAKYDETT